MSTRLLQLRDSIVSSRGSYDALNDLFVQFKIELASSAKSTEVDRLARDVLETAVLSAANASDFEALGRHTAQLKDYYFSPSLSGSPSSNESLVFALDLLRLLAKNELSAFHVELERIPFARQADPLIAYAIALERHLMEGSYVKLRSSCVDKLPHQAFRVFVPKILETVREEAAKSVEAAYKNLSVQYLTQLLMLQTPAEMQTYAKARGWTLSPAGDQFVFNVKKEEAKEYPAQNVILDTLFYAKEMEKIV
eukprot:ANDGO_03862.mRNA.1 putative 26S proteasome non-ATPase regulatory subunit 8